MRDYQTTYGGSQITGRRTAAFQALAESISGRDLTAFFQTWYFTPGKPAWPAKFNVNLAGPTDPGEPRRPGQLHAVAPQHRQGRDHQRQRRPHHRRDRHPRRRHDRHPADERHPGRQHADLDRARDRPGGDLDRRDPVHGQRRRPTATRCRASPSATTLGGTCLDCSASAVVGTAPISPAPVPTITGGTPTVGRAPDRRHDGLGRPAPAFTYQWLIDGTPVPGATGATYTPDGDVVGFAGHGEGDRARSPGSARSPRPAPPRRSASGPRSRPAPCRPSPARRRSAARRSPSTRARGSRARSSPTSGRANGANIASATGPTYTPAVASQVGQTLNVIVTGTKFGYTTIAKTSAATAPVAAGDPLVLDAHAHLQRHARRSASSSLRPSERGTTAPRSPSSGRPTA